ncbi:MAG: CPBP family intramembrane glutamic endopeptidase, partial [Methyloligellaceae bacterium]
SGDRLTELTHYIKIPEAFTRGYQEMRSANDSIAFGAAMAMVVLYLLGGCIIGLFFLLRQRWVLWRQPLAWGFFIAFLQLLSGLNQLPLAWMNFDTALSSQGFLLQQIAQNLANFLLLAVLLSASFMAAESLSRKAFPNHIRMWRLWATDVASTPPLLGRTVAGYLIIGLFFAYEVGLYFFSTNVLGWWTPSSALFRPDSLATYFPWLDSIAISAQAGFWEECLFRAIPIAGAALLGQKFGGRRYWIAGAFLLQAVIFGAAHANYPAQPAYARLVELIIPSLGFGFLYLYFGLLPAIVLHFAFDVAWFAMPLFFASTPTIWIDRSLVIFLTLSPLLVVLVARVRSGSWLKLGDQHYNRTWAPPAIEEKEPAVEQPEEPAGTISSLTRTIVFAAGLAGVLAWIFATEFSNPAPPVTLSRDEAVAVAQKTLAERNVELQEPWRILSVVEAPLNQNDRFAWQSGSPEAYNSLMGPYLGPPYWSVRFAKFEGDVAERAEEYEVRIAGNGEVIRFRHQLPEARAGASLAEENARALVDSTLRAQFDANPAALKFISSEPTKQEARTDWSFTFADTTGYPLEQGEARTEINISGDEVTDAFRYLYVPEEWDRQERSQRNVPQILEIACTV